MVQYNLPAPALVMLQGPQPNRAFTFPPGKPIVTLGRSPDNDWVIEDIEVSRHHARLVWQGMAWAIQDLGSANGTWVNGQRIVAPTLLVPGCQVGLGHSVLFSFVTAPIPAPPPPAYAPAIQAATYLPITQVAPPRPGKRRWPWLVASAAILLVVFAALLALFLARAYQVRAASAPPTVWVTEPVKGAAAPAGSDVTVSAIAFGRRPITRVELWLDGELIETQNSPQSPGSQGGQPEGVPTFYALLAAPVSAGPHLAFVRAVDTAGLIGQSLPLGLTGTDGPAETFYPVRLSAGQTSADIAAAYQLDPASVKELSVSPDALPGGAWVQLPIPAGQAPSLVPFPPTAELPVTSTAGGSAALVTVPGIQPAPPLPPGGSSISPPPPPAGGPPAPILSPAPPAAQGGNWQLFPITIDMSLPTAPSGLQAQLKDCQVRLTWTDKATNESRYEVWLAGPGAPPQLIATLKPAAGGPVAYEFTAPGTGSFSAWVEAINFYGKAPSNIAPVLVTAACAPAPATHLQVEALDMAVDGNYGRAYCYVSLQQAPETRLPADSTAFIKVQGGQGDIAPWAGGNHKWVTPIPASKIVDLSGECWGWAGKSLNKLGTFSDQFPSAAWDGQRRAIDGGGFRIGLAIKPLVPISATMPISGPNPLVPYGYPDPSLPVPYDLVEGGVRSIAGDTDPQERVLSWKWDGDPKKITGFMAYLDGKPYNLGWLATPPLTAAPNERQATVRLPYKCGEHVRWQISAVAGPAESGLSQPYEYDQLKCQVYAKVKFDRIWYKQTDGGCNTIDTSYELWVNGRTTYFWGGTFFQPVKCGVYTFADLGQYYVDAKLKPSADTLVVPLPADDLHVWLGVSVFQRTDLRNMLIVLDRVDYKFASLKEAQQKMGCSKWDRGALQEVFGYGTWAQFFYYLEMYPNTCYGDAPLPPYNSP